MEMIRTCKPLNTAKIMRSINVQVVISNKTAAPVSRHSPLCAERRRRQSLMDNYANKYAYSKINRTLHDRDCPMLQYIQDEDFEMTSEFDHEMQLCPICCRKAEIRSAIGDDQKRIDLYLRVFDDIGFKSKKLRDLFFKHDTHLLRVDINSVTLKVNEDTWILRYYSNKLELYHNNYIINDDLTRTFTQQYHLQKCYTHRDEYVLAISEMTDYSWEYHIDSTSFGSGPKYIKGLKEDYHIYPNYVMTRDSKYIATYNIVDINYQAMRFLAKEGVVVSIRGPLPCRFIGVSEPFELLQCRIRKKDTAAFETAMQKLKNYSLLMKAYEYIEVCQQLQ